MTLRVRFLRRPWVGWIFWRATLKQLGIFSVHLNGLDEAVDAEVSERLEPVFSGAIDPDGAVLDLHFVGDFM